MVKDLGHQQQLQQAPSSLHHDLFDPTGLLLGSSSAALAVASSAPPTSSSSSHSYQSVQQLHQQQQHQTLESLLGSLFIVSRVLLSLVLLAGVGF